MRKGEKGIGFKIIDVAFKFIKILVIREANKRMGVPQVGSTGRKTVELAVASS